MEGAGLARAPHCISRRWSGALTIGTIWALEVCGERASSITVPIAMLLDPALEQAAQCVCVVWD